MEGAPKTEISAEQYEDLLEIKLSGMEFEDFEVMGGSFPFIVSDKFTIFISASYHEAIKNKHGLAYDDSLVEGYVIFWNYTTKTKKEDEPEIKFKGDFYRENGEPSFHGSGQEFLNLKIAVKNKIKHYFETQKRDIAQ